MPAVHLSAPRLQSLDVFRGLTVAAMLLVNNPGSWEHIYPPLEHAGWNGWTPTDLVFPFFLFIVGVAIPFSLGRRLELGVARGALVGRIIFRSLLIVLLGILLNAIPHFDWATLRLPGVLQRIGVVYLLAGLIYLGTGWRGQIAAIALLLIGYWLAMTMIPVPGVGTGSLTVEANLAQYLDSRIFGTHMWRATWDPEGLLSTVPAVGSALLGILAGTWLRTDRSGAEKPLGLFLLGGCGIIAGMVWDHWFPINKNLWTSSYVLFTAGIAAQLLGGLYAVVDLRGHRSWAGPFFVLGSNALLVFGLSGLLGRTLINLMVGSGSERMGLGGWIYTRIFVPWAGALNGSLAYAVAMVLLFMIVLVVPYRRGWFLRF